MTYYLGKTSRRNLGGVDPALIAIVQDAITITEQDFSVFEGLRTLERQREYVARGVSWTLNSKHLVGEAVDLVPYIDGQLRWEWKPIYKIAYAVRETAKAQELPLRWGGAWDQVFTQTAASPEELIYDYIDRRRQAGKKIFVDGVHFELV